MASPTDSLFGADPMDTNTPFDAGFDANFFDFDWAREAFPEVNFDLEELDAVPKTSFGAFDELPSPTVPSPSLQPSSDTSVPEGITLEGSLGGKCMPLGSAIDEELLAIPQTPSGSDPLLPNELPLPSELPQTISPTSVLLRALQPLPLPQLQLSLPPPPPTSPILTPPFTSGHPDQPSHSAPKPTPRYLPMRVPSSTGRQPPPYTRITHGLNPLKKVSVKDYDWYAEMPDRRDFGNIQYQPEGHRVTGELKYDFLFTKSLLIEYINGLRALGKQLRIWVQHRPTSHQERFIKGGASDKCCMASCPVNNQTIARGFFQVAFDENPDDTGGVLDPFHVAGYAHLFCFEKCIDLPWLMAMCPGLVRPDTRHFEKEEKNPMSLNRDSAGNELEPAFRFWHHTHVAQYSAKGVAPPNVLFRIKSEREILLSCELTIQNLRNQQPGRQTMWEARGGCNMSVHRGNLDRATEGKRRIAVMKKKQAKRRAALEQAMEDGDFGRMPMFDPLGLHGMPIPNPMLLQQAEHMAMAQFAAMQRATFQGHQGYGHREVIDVDRPWPFPSGYGHPEVIGLNHPRPYRSGYGHPEVIDLENPQPTAPGYHLRDSPARRESAALQEILDAQAAAQCTSTPDVIDLEDPQPTAPGYHLRDTLARRESAALRQIPDAQAADQCTSTPRDTSVGSSRRMTRSITRSMNKQLTSPVFKRPSKHMAEAPVHDRKKKRYASA